MHVQITSITYLFFVCHEQVHNQMINEKGFTTAFAYCIIYVTVFISVYRRTYFSNLTLCASFHINVTHLHH